VPSEYTPPTGDGLSEDIKAASIDDLAQKHFPLCMRSMHDRLRRERHLKHMGRLQYGLFLKVSETPICVTERLTSEGSGIERGRSSGFLAASFQQ
jgi:hypothetical protein